MATTAQLNKQTENGMPARTAIRVLFFDHTAAMSGGEIALANLLAHLDPEKVCATVVLGAEGPLVNRLRPAFDVHVLPLSPRVSAQKKDSLGVSSLFRLRDVADVVAYIFRLMRFMRAYGIEVIHTNSLKSDLIGGVAGRMCRRRVIWHVRDRIEDDYLPKAVVRAFRLLARVIPTDVIANSAATLRSLRPGSRATATPQESAQKSKMVVVHDGTELVAAAKRNRGTSLRIGLIGRISPWKGQHVFIQAAKLVTHRFPEAKFVIIGAALFGEQEYEKEVRQLPAKLGIEEDVEFAGFCADVNRAIAGLDLVVHASTKGEPFGQVIIEGMAAGKPVVATDGGGVPEIVEDGKTGILVPMENAEAMAAAICGILSDPWMAAEMGRRGRERVKQRFTLERTARGVEQVYERALRK
jgi:glycosyltransferase involved in cell wall biosynthesis